MRKAESGVGERHIEDGEMAKHGHLEAIVEVDEWSEEDKDGVRGRNTLRLFSLLL